MKKLFLLLSFMFCSLSYSNVKCSIDMPFGYSDKLKLTKEQCEELRDNYIDSINKYMKDEYKKKKDDQLGSMTYSTVAIILNDSKCYIENPYEINQKFDLNANQCKKLREGFLSELNKSITADISKSSSLVYKTDLELSQLNKPH